MARCLLQRSRVVLRWLPLVLRLLQRWRLLVRTEASTAMAAGAIMVTAGSIMNVVGAVVASGTLAVAIVVATAVAADIILSSFDLYMALYLMHFQQ